MKQGPNPIAREVTKIRPDYDARRAQLDIEDAIRELARPARTRRGHLRSFAR